MAGVRRGATLVAALVLACSGGGRGRRDDAAPTNGSGGAAAPSADAAPGSEPDPSGAGAGSDDGDDDEPIGAGAGGVDAAPLPPVPGATTGDVVAKVVWTRAPAEVRGPGPRARCGRPGRAQAQVHTLWGVADVVVAIVDAPAAPGTPASAPAADAKPHELSIRLADCAARPRVVVGRAPVRLTVTLGEEGGRAVVLQPVPAPLGGLAEGAARTVTLPVIGHAAVVELPGPTALVIDPDGDGALVVVAPHRQVGVTDDTGAVRLTGVGPGKHPVLAWMPARAGRPERVVRGEVEVVAGRTAEVALELAGP